MMRLFTGLEVPADISLDLNFMQSGVPGARWIDRESMHITLRFIGELGESGLKQVVSAAREGVADHHRFEVALGAAGAFPDATRARVLWLGMSAGGEALVALAKSVEDALRRRGFEPADHPFGTLLDVYRDGYEFIAHSLAPAVSFLPCNQATLSSETPIHTFLNSIAL